MNTIKIKCESVDIGKGLIEFNGVKKQGKEAIAVNDVVTIEVLGGDKYTGKVIYVADKLAKITLTTEV